MGEFSLYLPSLSSSTVQFSVRTSHPYTMAATPGGTTIRALPTLLLLLINLLAFHESTGSVATVIVWKDGNHWHDYRESLQPGEITTFDLMRSVGADTTKARVCACGSSADRLGNSRTHSFFASDDILAEPGAYYIMDKGKSQSASPSLHPAEIQIVHR